MWWYLFPELTLLSISNWLLVVVNVLLLVRHLWQRKKSYQAALTMLEDEQGEWFVDKVVSHELARVLSHNTRDLDSTDEEDSDEEDSDEDEYAEYDEEDEDEDDEEDG